MNLISADRSGARLAAYRGAQDGGRKHGRRPAHIAIAWLLAQPAVSAVIIGAKRAEQLSENISATEIALDDAGLSALDEVSRLPREYPGWLLNAS